MKKTIIVSILIITIFTVSISTASAQSNNVFPSWFKNNAKWFHEGSITDKDVILGIENLIDQKIIIIKQPTSLPTDKNKNESKIPNYIKDVFGFWSDNKVSDSEIANSLQYLLEHGIIKSKKISENQEKNFPTSEDTEEPINCGGDDQAPGSFNSNPLSEKDKAKYKKVEDKITILKQPTKMTCAPTVGAMMIMHKNSTISPGVYKGTTSDLIDSLKKSMGTDEEKGSKPSDIANGIEKWLKGKDNGKNLSVKYTSESRKDGDLSGTIKFQAVGEITAAELLSELNQGENIMVMAKDDKGNKHALFIIGASDKPDEYGKIGIAYVDPRRGMVQGTVGYGGVIIDETNDENWDPLAKVSIVPTISQASKSPEHAMVLDKNQAEQVAVILIAHEKATELLLNILNHDTQMYSDLADTAWDSYDTSKDQKTMQQATSYDKASKASASDAKTTVKILNSARNQVKLHEDTYDLPIEKSGTLYSNLETLSSFSTNKIKNWDDLVQSFKNAQDAIRIGHKNYQQLVFGTGNSYNQTMLINSDKVFWETVCRNPDELTDLPFSIYIQDQEPPNFGKRCWAYQTIFDGPVKIDEIKFTPLETIPSIPSPTSTPETGQSFTVTPTLFSWVHNIGGTSCPQDVTSLFLNTSGPGTVKIISKPTYLDVNISGSNADVNFNCILTQYNSQTLSGQLVFTFTNTEGTESSPVNISFTGQINKP